MDDVTSIDLALGRHCTQDATAASPHGPVGSATAGSTPLSVHPDNAQLAGPSAEGHECEVHRGQLRSGGVECAPKRRAAPPNGSPADNFALVAVVVVRARTCQRGSDVRNSGSDSRPTPRAGTARIATPGRCSRVSRAGVGRCDNNILVAAVVQSEHDFRSSSRLRRSSRSRRQPRRGRQHSVPSSAPRRVPSRSCPARRAGPTNRAGCTAKCTTRPAPTPSRGAKTLKPCAEVPFRHAPGP